MPGNPVYRSAAFREDIIEHFITIGLEQPAAAERFASAVDRLLEQLAEWPLSGHAYASTRPELSTIRVLNVPGYKVLVFYRVADDRSIEVIRALHGALGDLADVLAAYLADERQP